MAETRKENQAKEKKTATKNNTKQATNSGKVIKLKRTLQGKATELKQILKDIDKLPKMDNESIDKFLAAIALGLVPDRFGMDASLDTKLKAIDMLTKKQLAANKETDDAIGGVEIVDDIKDDC